MTTALVDAEGARLGSKSGSTASWLVFDLLGSVAALEGTANTSVTGAFRYDAFWMESIRNVTCSGNRDGESLAGRWSDTIPASCCFPWPAE